MPNDKSKVATVVTLHLGVSLLHRKATTTSLSKTYKN